MRLTKFPRLAARQYCCWSPVAIAVAGLLPLAVISKPVGAEELAPVTQAQLPFFIHRNTADEALIDFAEQAGLTIAFPYNKVRHTITNPVEGALTIRQAMSGLLKGTGLSARFDEHNNITILVDEAPAQSESMLARWFRELTAAQDELLTVPLRDNQDRVEYIEVKGLRARTTQSVSIKRDAEYVLETVQSLEMGKFPDQNLAEALQRVPGVSIDRAEGEGQFVSVRGFGPQFNNVLLNGRQMATDTLGRQFSFDTLAPEMVNAVTVHKQGQAGLPGGGVGATINIQTAKPLALRGLRVAGSVKMQYDSNAGQYTPQGSLLFSDTFNHDTMGLLVSLSYYARDARIDEAQIDGWVVNTGVPAEQLDKPVDNLYVPRKYDQRVRFETRRRQGATVVYQYRPAEDLALTLDYLGTDFSVDSSATSIGHWFTSSNLEDVVTDTNGTAIRFSQRTGHATDFHARSFNRNSVLHSLGANLQWEPADALMLSLDIATSRAQVDDPDGDGDALSLIGYLNQSTFDHTQGNILPAIYGFESANPLQQNAAGELTGVSHYLDPANSRTHVMLKRGWQIEDSIDQAALNVRWVSGSAWLAGISAGLRYSHQQKDNERRDNEYNGLHCYFCGYFDSPQIPLSFQTRFNAGDSFLSSVSGSDTIPHQWLRHDGPQLFSYLEALGNVDLSPVRRGNSYSVSEKVWAGYVNTSLELPLSNWFLSANLGMRAEYTQVSVSAVNEVLSRLVILDQTELGPVFEDTQAEFSQFSYSNWLPAVSLRAAWQENWVVRAGYSRSLTRPTLEQMSPGTRYTTTRQGGDLRAFVGNPQLRPFESDNLDVALEYYYGDSNYLSAGVYRKYVDNFITINSQPVLYASVTDPSTGSNPLNADDQDSAAWFDVARPVNGRTAVVDGLELSAQHLFGKTGWGLQANYSQVDSNAELDKYNVNSKFALTGLSGARNLVLFYEKGALQWRLAWNYREGFLQSLEQPLSTEPTYVSPYKQWDMSASYQVTSQLSIFFEGINLTDEIVHKHGRFANQLLLIQDTGSRFAVGFRATY